MDVKLLLAPRAKSVVDIVYVWSSINKKHHGFLDEK